MMSTQTQIQTLQQKFVESQEILKKFTKRPNDDELLHIYGLYKQSTIGDINIPRPGILAFKEKTKWNAWNSKKDMKRETAMQSYVDFVKALQKRENS